MDYTIRQFTVLAAVLSCAPVSAEAQLVTDAVGTIDLYLSGFSALPPYDIVYVTDTAPVGLVDSQWQIDLSHFATEDGRIVVDYGYEAQGPASARFDIHTDIESSDGFSNAHAGLVVDLTFVAPVRYRVDAEINVGNLGYYDITFNNIAGTAYWDQLTAAGGTFPLIYYGQAAYGWYPWVDEGVLPAGQHRLSIETLAHTSRYGDLSLFEATASLSLWLLGDVNLDGFVGLADLGAVLDDWNKTAPVGGSLTGDLNGDGFVGIADLNMVLGAWNADVRLALPANVIPEPTAAVILVAVSLAMCGRRITLRAG